MAVTRDATSGKWVPATAAEWTSLLSGTGISNPIALWGYQEASGNLADSIGTWPLTKFNSPTYQNTVPGWARKGVHYGSPNDSFYNVTAGLGDIQSASHLLLAFAYLNAAPTATARIMSFGLEAKRNLYVTTTPHLEVFQAPGSTFADGSANPLGSRILLLQEDKTNSADVGQSDQETVSPTYVSASGNSSTYLDIGPDAQGTGIDYYVMYAAAWRGAGAELTNTQRATLIDRLSNGPAVTSVSVAPSAATIGTIGGTQALTATATRADGTTFDVTATATWTTSSGSTATVSSSGLVTAVANGTATITATYTSLNATPAAGTSAITVAAGGVTLTSITISPGSVTVASGNIVNFAVTGHFSDSSTSDVTSACTWSDANSHTVTFSGLTTGFGGPGIGFVTASKGGFTATAEVVVSPLPLDENEHHPWPGIARGIWDFGSGQVVWTGDRVLAVRDGNYSLGDSPFWNRNFTGPSQRRGIPAYLPLQTDVTLPVTGPGANCSVDTCLTTTQRVVISTSTFTGSISLDVINRSTGALIWHQTFTGTAPEAPRVFVSAGRLVATWMDNQPGDLRMVYWTGSAWTNPQTLVSQVYAYDTAVAIDGVHFLWRAFSAATGGPNALFVGKLLGTTAATVPYAWGTSVDTSGAGHNPDNAVAFAIAPDATLGIAFGSGTTYVFARAYSFGMVAQGSWSTISNTGFDAYGGLTICSRGLRNSAQEYEWLVHFVNANGVNIDSFYPTAGLTIWQERRTNCALVSKSFRVGDEVFVWMIERNATTVFLVGGHYQSQVCGFADRESGYYAAEDGIAAFLPQVTPDPLTSGDSSGPFVIVKTGGVNGTWDSQAVSLQTIAKDGYLDWTCVNTGRYAFGLSTVDTNASWDTINYSVLFNGATCFVVENGTTKFTSSYVAGDVWRINRTAGVITYLKNGTVIYTSASSSTVPLLVDSSFQDTGSAASAVRFVDTGIPVVATFNTKGVVVVPQSSGYGPTATGSAFTWARQFTTGQSYNHPGNVKAGDIEFLPPLSTAEYGKCTYVSGSAVRCWDGTELGDAGFQSYPTVTGLVTASGGSLSAGPYLFRVYAVRYNKQGERFESAAFTSFSVTVTSSQKITVTIQCLPCTNHSDVQLEVYRTEALGTTFYYDGVVANSTTATSVTYVSTISDASLRTHAGDPHATGVGQVSELESFGPLGCAVLCSANDRLWGAGGQVPAGSVAFSKLHNDGFGVGVDDIAGTQEVDIEGGVITSIAGMGSTTVAFETNKLFVINGSQGPDNDGNGSFGAPDIVLADGAISHAGTQLTQVGVVYWGAGGPRVLTHSYEVLNISIPVRLLTKTLVPTGCRVDFQRQEVVWYTASGTAVLWNYLNGSSRWARWTGLAIAGASPLALATTDGRVLYQDEDADGDAGQEFEFRLKSGLLQAEKIIGGGTFIRALGLTGSFVGPHTVRMRMFYDGSPLWSEEWVWQPQTGTYLSLGTDYSSSTPAQVDALKMINQSGSYLTHKRTARNHCAYLQVEISDQGAANKTFVPTEITLEIGVMPGLARVSPNTFGD